ncbi:MAG TPA: hypothetical protein VK961_23445 [Chthoniobacter sp.]|nr:hypothetical protein [Chthoniobacter sp.]
MPIRRIVSHRLYAVACLALFAGGLRAELIPLSQVPPAVQKGIQAQLGNGTLGNGTLGKIDRDEEEGQTVFTAEISKAGPGRDYTFSEAGELLRTEVFLTEAPPAVQKAIRNLVAQGKLASIDKTVEEGEVRYDFDWKTKEGVDRSASVLESGELESLQVSLQETPPAVQAAITQEAGSGQIKDVVKSFEDKAVYYDVTIQRDGKDRDFTMRENGKLESRQVFLEEIPAPAQQTIQKTIGAGKVLRIDQVFEKKKNVFPFEVESVIDGKAYDFSVGPKGLFLGVD